MAELLYKAKKDVNGVKAIEDIPVGMDAVVTRGDKQIYFRRDFPTPKVGPKGAIVRVDYSGICHTDTSARDGYMQKMMGIDPNGDVYRVLGHEFSGKVIAIGPKVDEYILGKDVIALALYGYCGECQPCKKEQYNLCRSAVFPGVQRDGGLAQYFTIEDADYLISLPEKVSTKDAFPVGDALMTARNALKIIDANKDDYLAVWGAVGGLGLSTIENALAIGIPPKHIWALDVRGNLLKTLEERLGVNILDTSGKKVGKDLMKASEYRLNKGVDAVGSGGRISSLYKRIAEEGIPADKKEFEAMVIEELTRGTVMDGYEAIIKGGGLSVIGARFGEHILIPVINFMGTEKKITGPWGAPYTVAVEVLDDIAKKRLKPEYLELLRGAEYPFEPAGVEEGFKALESGEVMGRVFFNIKKS